MTNVSIAKGLTTEHLTRASALARSWYPLTMASGVRAAMARAPGKLALTHGRRSLSYSDLVRRASRATSATIRTLGLKPGENIALVARNCIEYFEIVLGVPEAGVAVATVNPRFTTREVEAVCDDAEARAILTDSASAEIVRAGRYRTVEHIIEFGPEYEQWLATGDAPADLPSVEEWDTWTIPYTSGTTGKPKGVLLSHRGRTLISFAAAAEFGCFSPDDRFLAMTPLNHGAGLSFPIASLLTGGSVELMDRFEPIPVLDKLKFGGITGIFMVPTHFHQMFELDAQLLEPYRRPPLRALISNAAPLPQKMKEKIVPFFGDNVLFEIYGSTEAGYVSSLRPADQLRKLSCVGLPHSQACVRLIASDGRECRPEEVGEIWSRSPWLFSGYWRRDAETDAAFSDGWVSVGDLGKRDEEGYLYIVDRKKDMIISAGVNIYPREIEEILLRHPAIADAAVVGVADEKWGERPRAFVVLRAGASLAIEELVSFCTGSLSTYKIPRELRVIDALPRNMNGKVLKTELRARP